MAERLGVEVRFCGGDSFGGMYARVSNTILVPALRPPGRQAFTCGHELGHWFFGHGTHIDELKAVEHNSKAAPQERLANIYASYLLMPPWAVEDSFAKRCWKPSDCSPVEIYAVACQLGVGYETIVQHLRWSLALITSNRADELLKTSPKQLREYLLVPDRIRHLVVTDCAWTKIAVDLQVGDAALLPDNVKLEGKSAIILGKQQMGTLVEGCKPGITRAESCDNSWCAYIRVSRIDFVGRSTYRHLEDPDAD
ncbi:MAG: ImmA/IrrE family metallo-endopeptidase [Limisphaerales bacterium]